MAEKKLSAERARELLRSETGGVLSTQSRVLVGYPFGSVVPYCLDADGFPVILISNLAQHTRNIVKNSKVSLTVAQNGDDNIQTRARLTWLGDAEKVTDETSANRYYSFFPESRDYHKTHDFEFYRIVPVRSRYIGGFGDIHWLDNDLIAENNSFSGELEESILEHMNQDHRDALRKYCDQAGIEVSADDQPEMAGADPYGFHIRIGTKLVRIPFTDKAENAGDVRRFLAKMARLS